MSTAIHGVIPAAGIGTRMAASVPKQYLQIEGSTLLELSLQALLRTPGLVSVTIAIHPEDTWAAGLALLTDPRVRLVTGGAERADSVLAALRAVPGASTDWVLVHDAARPGLRQADLESLVSRVTGSGQGGILAEPMVDTVKQAGADGSVQATLDRSLLWRAQTPQMFRLGELVAALENAAEQGLAVTDEASAMELAGHAVQLVPGSPDNLKVTTPRDLALVAWYLAQTGEHS